MKSNILKKLLLSTICCIFIANGFAQEIFQQSDIVKKKWKSEIYIKKGIHMFLLKYTNTKEISINRFWTSRTNQYYYLSDNIDTVFDISKIGNSSSGKYIITKQLKDSILYIDEILVLTDNTLIVRNTPWVNYVGGSGIRVYHTRNYKNTKQQTFQLSDIVDKKWKMDSIFNSNYNLFIEYKSNEKCINKSIEYKKEEIVEYEYYLSDSIETTFNKSKVGNNTNGRYIIQRDKGGYLYIYEILKLTNDKLILKALNSYEHYIIPLHLVEE